MKLSKLPLLLLTSFSLLASAALLSCNNSTGSGSEGDSSKSKNIEALNSEDGIEIIIKTSDNNRIVVSRIVDNDKNSEKMIYMTNINSSEGSLKFVDSYVIPGKKYTYTLKINDQNTESVTIKAEHGKGMLPVTIIACNEGVKIQTGNFQRLDNSLLITRYAEGNGDGSSNASINLNKNTTEFIDKYVKPGQKYRYEARLNVFGDMSGNRNNNIYAYSEPVVVTAGADALGVPDLGNQPAGYFDSDENKLHFTTLPEITPDMATLGISYWSLAFYHNGNGFRTQWNSSMDYYQLYAEPGTYTIDGYCIGVGDYSIGAVQIYYYETSHTLTKLSKLPKIEITKSLNN